MCGVIGIIGTPQSAFETYKGLYTLQHRGQDAAGILSYHFKTQKFRLVKETGLVSEVFDESSIRSLEGEMAIGHTRYSTVGRGEKEDLQPQLLNYPMGIGMAHNGNLINYHELVEKLKKQHERYSLTNNDVEVMMNLFASFLSKIDGEIDFKKIFQAMKLVQEQLVGGYAAVAQIADIGMFAFRDPRGLRPLVLGSRALDPVEKNKSNLNFERSYMFCSETNSLDFLGYEKVKDVAPGELVFIDRHEKIHSKKLKDIAAKPCMFEWVYFSSAESIFDGKSVYEKRLALGEVLGEKVSKLVESGEIEPDIVAPIPETSRLATISLSSITGITYREVLIKNRYIQRSFILGSDSQRSKAVQLKLLPVAHEVKGRNILLVDDSIVRGTTSRLIIQSLRKAGANKVYLASTCPEIRNPCFFGVDFPDKEKLVAVNRTQAEIEKVIDVDKIIYISKEELQKALGSTDLCMACVDGEYPVDMQSAQDFQQNRKEDLYASRELNNPL